MLHAIGGGVLVAEIQQSSNVTYRIYDYGRVGADGKTRPLHIKQALDVTRLERPAELEDYGKYLMRCKYFDVECLSVTADKANRAEVTDSSFASIVVVKGEIKVTSRDGEVKAVKGESLFLPAGLGEYEVTGDGEYLVTTIP